MTALDPIIACELPVIEKIIADETWLEGERRGCWVPPEDPIVCDNVCQVILRIGAALRAAFTSQSSATDVAASEATQAGPHLHAA